MTTPTELHLYTNDCDTVIASSMKDAAKVLEEYGYSDVDPDSLEEVEPDHALTIHCDATGTPATPGDKGVSRVTKTAAEWARRGRGFLCTTEY